MRRLVSTLCATLACAAGCGSNGEGAPATDAPPSAEAGFVVVPPREVTLRGASVRIEATAHLFYNLRPADERAADAPLFVVFNGFSAEVVRAFGTGPTTVADGGAVVANPASLTRFANVLYVEPRQAGFSYDEAPGRSMEPGDCSPAVFNEYVDAADVLLGVLAFLRAHPGLRGPVYWVGESYAGVRVQWILAYLRDRWSLAPYEDPTLAAEIRAMKRPGSLRAGQILLQPWLAGKAHADAIAAACLDPAAVVEVEASVGTPCAVDACACAKAHGRSLYNHGYTSVHQTAREREASDAHVTPARAEALLGVPLESVAGLTASARGDGFKCSPPDASVPPESELVARLGELPVGQAYYVPYSPLLPGKETSPAVVDWREANLVGTAFVDNLEDVPAFVTDGARDLVVPTRALVPALAAVVGDDRVAAEPGGISVAYGGAQRHVAVRRYPGAGHMVTMLEADAFSADVAAWLASR